MLLLPIQIVILTIKEGFRMIIEVFGSSWGPGAFLGLQIQWSACDVDGGFDSHILPPTSSPARLPRIGGHFIFVLKIPKSPQFYPARHHEPSPREGGAERPRQIPVTLETLRAIGEGIF